MKKILMTLGAILTFGIASAQVPPSQPQQTQPDPVPTVKDKDKKTNKDANIQNQVIDPAKPVTTDQIQPRKDELKTRDHVKSTPDPNTVKDTAADRKKTKMKKKKQ